MASSGGKLFITGHQGLVGRALLRHYADKPEWQIITRTRAELDLRDQHATDAFFAAEKPDQVILSAATVGGIKASYTHPVDFLLNNLQIQNSVLSAAHRFDTRKVLFLGSTCIYPKAAEIPIREDSLMTGPMESTNEPYGVAKIAGIKLGQAYRRQYGCDFISSMPCNLYGIGDNFDLMQSHVIPALLVKAHQAKLARAPTMDVWGTGAVRREFLFADDAADGMVFLMKNYSDEPFVNLGPGSDIPIRDLVALICKVVGYKGGIRFDTSRPDGAPRKMLDASLAASIGWRAQTPLETGLEATYRWYVDHASGEKQRAVA